MQVESCMPVIPSADLEKSLRFWVEGLGLTMDRAMRRRDGRLIGCMVHKERHTIVCISPPAPAPLFSGRKVSFYDVRGFGLLEILETG